VSLQDVSKMPGQISEVNFPQKQEKSSYQYLFTNNSSGRSQQ